jgi:hypothetical protein
LSISITRGNIIKMEETGIENSEDMMVEDEDFMDEDFEIIGGNL